MYSDEDNELIGIDKTLCSRLKMITHDNEIQDITFYNKPDGKLTPEKDLQINERKLKGFIWRENERPKDISDLFSEKDNKYKQISLKKIKTPKAFKKY